MFKRADAIVPGDTIHRKRLSGATETAVVIAVRRQHEGSVTRYGFDTSPREDFLGWFTPSAPISVKD